MNHKERRLRLAYAAATLLCVAVVVSLLFIYLRRFDQTLMEENRVRLCETSGHISVYMQKMVEEQQNELCVLADTAVLIPDLEGRVKYLGHMADKLGFEYVGVAGPDGILHASALLEPEDISEEGYYQTARAGEVSTTGLIRHIFYDRAVGGVIVAAPVPDASGQVAVAMLSMAKLSADVQVESFGGEGYSYIIDRNGDLVLHARSLEYGNLFQSLENMRFADGYSLDIMRMDIEAGREGMTAYSDFEVDKYAYYRPLGFQGWTVVSTVPCGVLTERTASLSSDLVLICAAVLLVFLGLITAIGVLFLRLESRRRANQAKSAFLANMSHDMRTPMNAVIGMTAIAAAHADEPETVRGCLRKIDASSRHLLGLINDVLDMSRIESGKMAMGCEPFSLPEVMESTISMVYPAIRAKRQHFSVRLHGVKHEHLIGDGLRLSQVFINILTNAMKFTPEEGRITVDVTELPEEAEGVARFRFAFADSGIGMKPEFLADIFSAFTRAEDSKVDKVEGSGLGMAITKRILDLMGGTIEVESREGKGTVFTITLAQSAAGSEPAPPALPPCRVLVAGMEEAQGREAVRVLEALGLQGGWAAGGSEAAQLLTRAASAGTEYRVVLLDRSLLDSGEVKPIRAAGGADTALLLLDYEWEEVQTDALSEGISAFAAKPLFQSTLYRCLYEALCSPATEQTKVPEQADFSGRHVLLVEDNELNLEIIQVMLQETGVETISARNGAECVKRFRELPEGELDLILMDIQMPVMNGYEAARQIRGTKRADASIPILAMSANAYAEDIAAAKDAGMDGYLTKPIDVERWMREIGKYLAP